MAGFSYHFDSRKNLDLIEIPMGASWRPMWRGRDRKARWPVYVEIIHSSGGRIPKKFRIRGDLGRSRRRHSRIIMRGNLRHKDSLRFIMILQDDDTKAMAGAVGRSVNSLSESFGQTMLMHHEMAHVLLMHSQRTRRRDGGGRFIMEEGYCDAFSMALTLAQTNDIPSARQIFSIRSEYLALRRQTARSEEIKALRPGRGDFESRCRAGLTVLASLNYVLCPNAMEYVIDRWIEKPWHEDISVCSNIAMNWINDKGVTEHKSEELAAEALLELLGSSDRRVSLPIKIFMKDCLYRQKAGHGPST